MIVDCDRCAVRGDACRDCVVGVLLGMPGIAPERSEESDPPSGARSVQLDAPEFRALSVLADQGLVPRLRLVATEQDRSSPGSRSTDGFSDVG
ncbi:MAG TPA: hypothetical protein VGH99_14540 [Pseudonocardia sp.]|jgi:hypothetical protein